MPWVAKENFESYKDGDNLNGKTGGSGWSSAWTDAVAGTTVAIEPAGGPGSLALKSPGGKDIYRTYSVLATGKFSFYFNADSTSPSDNIKVQINSGATLFIDLRIRSGNLYDLSGIFNLITAISDATWYKLDVIFDAPGNVATFLLNGVIVGGTNRSQNGALTTVDTFRVQNDSAATNLYVDNISPPIPTFQNNNFLKTTRPRAFGPGLAR